MSSSRSIAASGGAWSSRTNTGRNPIHYDYTETPMAIHIPVAVIVAKAKTLLGMKALEKADKVVTGFLSKLLLLDPRSAGRERRRQEQEALIRKMNAEAAAAQAKRFRDYALGVMAILLGVLAVVVVVWWIVLR